MTVVAAVSSEPGLAVAAVARRLGVAPATLRTWDRRYGLGPSARTAGSHRRYTQADVARLMIMRRLTLEGVAPVDAAKSALDASDDTLAPAIASLPTTSARPQLRAIPGGREFAAPRRNPSDLPMDASARVAAVIDAALAFDQDGCDALLSLPPSGDPGTWWTSLVEPAWARIVQRTVLGTPGEEPELVLANAALGALRDFTSALDTAKTDSGEPPPNHPSRMRKIVLIFAAPDEMVPLAAHALAAALVAAGATARIVTGPASAHRAVELVTMVRPAALVLATTLARPDLDVVHAVNEAFAELPIFVGLHRQDAASSVPVAANVQRTRSFTGLLHEVLAVVA